MKILFFYLLKVNKVIILSKKNQKVNLKALLIIRKFYEKIIIKKKNEEVKLR